MIIPPKKVKTGIAATYNTPKELCTNDKQEQTSGNDSDNCYIIFPLKKAKIEFATQEIEVEFQIEHKPKKHISYQQTRRYIDCGVYDSVDQLLVMLYLSPSTVCVLNIPVMPNGSLKHAKVVETEIGGNQARVPNIKVNV